VCSQQDIYALHSSRLYKEEAKVIKQRPHRPLAVQKSAPPCIKIVFWAPKSLHPKQDLDPFSHFLHSADAWQTGLTHHATGSSVAIGRISCIRCGVCSFVVRVLEKQRVSQSNNISAVGSTSKSKRRLTACNSSSPLTSFPDQQITTNRRLPYVIKTKFSPPIYIGSAKNRWRLTHVTHIWYKSMKRLTDVLCEEGKLYVLVCLCIRRSVSEGVQTVAPLGAD